MWMRLLEVAGRVTITMAFLGVAYLFIRLVERFLRFFFKNEESFRKGILYMILGTLLVGGVVAGIAIYFETR